MTALRQRRGDATLCVEYLGLRLDASRQALDDDIELLGADERAQLVQRPCVTVLDEAEPRHDEVDKARVSLRQQLDVDTASHLRITASPTPDAPRPRPAAHTHGLRRP